MAEPPKDLRLETWREVSVASSIALCAVLFKPLNQWISTGGVSGLVLWKIPEYYRKI